MKTTKKFFALMMTLTLMASIPMQVKAAEVAQSTEVQFVELQAECYYKQVDYGIFERYDAEGTTFVEDALFKVNSTLTEGWGQYKQEGKVVEGSFKEATLDTKGYLRCKFTTGSTVYNACVKVKLVDWASAQKKATVKSTGKGTGESAGGNGESASGNGESAGGNGESAGGNGESAGGNGGSAGGNGGSAGGNGGGSTGDPNPGNQGWTDGPTQGDPNPGNQGWTDQPTATAEETA